jgi:hypothetical protein
LEDIPADLMRTRVDAVMREQLDEALPGFDEYLKNDSKAAGWLAEQEAKIKQAVRDEDSILLERALGSWVKAVGRVNEILAEQYRQANPSAAGDGWELRYVKWMTKVKYIRFECPLGEFYVVPRMPTRRPKAAHWYTVDELIDMLHPIVAETITAFGALPARPGSLPGPGPNEKHLTFDATGPEVVMTYSWQGGPSRGRRNVR